MTKPLAGHSALNPMAPSGNDAPRTGGKSKIEMSHPTLRPQNSWQERKRSGTSVPVPPELNLP